MSTILVELSTLDYGVAVASGTVLRGEHVGVEIGVPRAFTLLRLQ